jgi:hypothetical protein
MVLDASKTNPAGKCKSIYQYVQNYPREMQTNSLILAKNPQTNENKSADFSAFGNGFRCIQNQSLDKCKQIGQFIAHENGFGWVQNQPCRKMQINLRILAQVKMVLDASKTNI